MSIGLQLTGEGRRRPSGRAGQQRCFRAEMSSGRGDREGWTAAVGEGMSSGRRGGERPPAPSSRRCLARRTERAGRDGCGRGDREGFLFLYKWHLRVNNIKVHGEVYNLRWCGAGVDPGKRGFSASLD